jgi:hypothetical protein
MDTSDGIAGADWDSIHELALDVVKNADAGELRKAARARLLAQLESLERKYGARPSILATRADYVDDPLEREDLFHEAFQLATRIADEKNLLHIAHSLTEFYLEQRKAALAGEWLNQLRECLRRVSDSDYERDCVEFDAMLERLENSNASG